MENVSNIFAVAASFVLPLGVAVWLSALKKGYIKPILLGAATFFVFQILLRMPLIQYVISPMPWFITMSIMKPVATALFYGVTAALFEEGGRYLVMRLFMKKSRPVTDGIAFGVGHGGIEAILLVGVNSLVSLMAGIAFYSWVGLAAGFERIFTLLIHIALSVMVLKSVDEKKPIWLILAFALHAIIDTWATLAQQYGISLFAIEASVGVFAIIMALFTVFQYDKYKGTDVK